MNKLKLIMIFVFGIVLVSLMNFIVAGEIIWSDGTITNFKITDINPVCENGKFWITWENDEEVKTSVDDGCFIPEGWPSTMCCPEENECIETDTNVYGCEGRPSPFFCEDYTAERYGGGSDGSDFAQLHCEGFNENVAIRSVEEKVGIDGFCGSYESEYVEGRGTCYWLIYDCACEWDDEEDICTSKYSQSGQTCYGDPFTELGNCTFSATNKEDNCAETGFATYTWIAEWEGEEPKDEECEGGTREFPCLSTATLSFFTTISLILGILLLIILYSLIVKKKRKYKGKKGKKKRK